MRLIALLLFASLSSVTMATPELEAWEIDKQHTSVSFDIGHLGISKIRGSMMVDSGSLKANPQDLTKTELDVKIDVNTLNTGVPARDTHVKSNDFLSAATHPYITFKSTAVREDKAANKIFIDGNLTIKGVTKNITLTASPISEEVRLPKDGKEKVIRATTATTSINRYDFGVDYGKATGANKMMAKLIDGGVGQNIDITIHTEFFKVVPKGTATAKTN